MLGILGEGLWEFVQAEPPDWPQRRLTLDLAYGVASWTLNEAWRTNKNGKGCKDGTGLTYQIYIDRPNDRLDPSCTHSVWFNFYNFAKYTGDPQGWSEKFEQYLRRINGNGVLFGEIGTIFEDAVIGEVLNPEPLHLVVVPVQVTRPDAHSYHISWMVPPGTHSYRIKYSDKNIVEWLSFDPVTNQFITDPNTNVPWFAATELANVPVPVSAGTVQTVDVKGLADEKQWHFAVKAYIQREAH